MPAEKVEENFLDAPFFANDSFEGSNKANRRLAMHKLHSGLDLKNVPVTTDMFCRGRVKRQMSRARHKSRNQKKKLTTSMESENASR